MKPSPSMMEKKPVIQALAMEEVKSRFVRVKVVEVKAGEWILSSRPCTLAKTGYSREGPGAERSSSS